MESQESDICNPDDMEFLVNEPGVNHLIDSADWGAIHVPSPLLSIYPTGELPARSEWPGVHLFDSKVDFTGVHKKNYVVSHKLNRIYVDMDKVVPFQIHWDGQPGLFVRALMVFTQADHLKTPVRRCITHRDKDNPMNTSYEHNDHVLATLNDNAKYAFDEQSSRFSVVVPLHLQHGCDHALISYKFMCKTSCTGGLNRSPTDIIFTLEDAGGLVLGRQTIGVKICSCPKRDKEKDEANINEPPSKRKTKVKKDEKRNYQEPATKKIKTEFNSEHHVLNPMYPYSFTVSCSSLQVADILKNHIRHWNEIKSVEWSQAGTPEVTPPPLISIIDEVAVLPQPYL